MYQLKSAIKGAVGRSAYLTGAVFMLGGLVASALPTVVHADALNPLTERSLMLSSSSPGWAYTDGSGNTTFAPPGSGPNGLKTGETFSFKVSTDSVATSTPIKAFTFQYCTAPAGNCTPPGNGTDASLEQSNLDIKYTSPAEDTDFNVYVGSTMTVGNKSTGWTMTTARKVVNAGTTTTEKNFITLVNSTGISPTAGTKIWVVFKATSGNYITNPGEGAFFVKINDYSEDGVSDPNDIDPLVSTKIIDGGVTVANVMNESIHITTKVLETMSFSVGTTNPDTVVLTGSDTHGGCDPISVNDQIQLGDDQAEFSLSPMEAFDAHSYWRLSTNSSGGATVYYSGDTLNNTVGDNIDAIGTTAQKAHYGTEQFGLALDSTADTIDTAHGAVAPTLAPLSPVGVYGGGAGTIDETVYTDNTALFAFTAASSTTPEPIANYTADVINCSTGKMRYIGNIAASTPAGVYTTKINYIAAPQY